MLTVWLETTTLGKTSMETMATSWASFGRTGTSILLLADRPALSLTVNVTVKLPGDVYTWLVKVSKLKEPSPKLQDQLTMKPSGSKLPDPSKTTIWPTTGPAGVMVKLATGGLSSVGVTETLTTMEWDNPGLVPVTVTV